MSQGIFVTVYTYLPTTYHYLLHMYTYYICIPTTYHYIITHYIIILLPIALIIKVHITLPRNVPHTAYSSLSLYLINTTHLCIMLYNLSVQGWWVTSPVLKDYTALYTVTNIDHVIAWSRDLAEFPNFILKLTSMSYLHHGKRIKSIPFPRKKVFWTVNNPHGQTDTLTQLLLLYR
jgi:hypothetical protein